MAFASKAPVAVDVNRDVLLRFRVFASAGLILFILVFTKAALAQGLSASVLLLVMVIGYVALCALSVPIAVAFLLASAQLLAQVSMTHPATSAFGTLSLAVLGAAMVIRWRQGWLRSIYRKRWRHLIPWALFAAVFATGFLRAGLGRNDAINSLHYVFLGHWLVYMALGVLACTRLAELKIFLRCFALLYFVAVYPLPFDFYPGFFENIYYKCEPMGLHNMAGKIDIPGSVNRSQVGYLAAMASLVSLSFAHHRQVISTHFFYTWSLAAVVVLFLAGTKGAVLGWVAGLFVVWRYADFEQRLEGLRVSAVVLSVIGIAILAGFSPLPCGTVKQYLGSTVSYETRRALLQQNLDTFTQPANDPQSTDPIKAEPNVEVPPVRVPDTIQQNARIAMAQSSSWVKPLLGSGFGTSAEGINPDTGTILGDAGSHNLFLDLLVDTGAIGLALFVLGVTLLIIQFVRCLLKVQGSDQRLIKAAFGSMLVVELAMLFLTTSTYREYLGASLLGLLGGFVVYLGEEPSRRIPNQVRLSA